MNSFKMRLLKFIENNENAGVSDQVIDLCAAYARQCNKTGKEINFYKPEPTLQEIKTSQSLDEVQIERLQRFQERQLELGLDETVIRLCIAYAWNLMAQGAEVLFEEEQLAQKLKIPIDILGYLTSEEYRDSYGYKRFQIPKRNGTPRQITAPDERLKYIQRWILDHVLANIPIHDAAHGFRPDRSIITNARPHVGKELVVKIDLKDFFPSITFSRVLGIFQNIGYTHKVALLLTRLVTDQGVLPQGSPTSPVLSNLVCRSLDARLSGLGNRLGYSYTRYADDITFSTSQKIPPDNLLRVGFKIIKEEGFAWVRQKLCVQRKGRRQVVTGLVVNNKLSSPRSYRRQLRAVLHNCKNKGIDSQNQTGDPAFLERIRGQIEFVRSVDPVQGERLLYEFNKL